MLLRCSGDVIMAGVRLKDRRLSSYQKIMYRIYFQSNPTPPIASLRGVGLRIAITQVQAPIRARVLAPVPRTA